MKIKNKENLIRILLSGLPHEKIGIFKDGSSNFIPINFIPKKDNPVVVYIKHSKLYDEDCIISIFNCVEKNCL